MQNPLSSSLNRKRPQLSSGSRWLALLSGVAGALVLLSGILFIVNMHHAQCPSSSFKDGLLYSGLGLAFGIVIGTISVGLLEVSILGRCNVWTYADGYAPPPIWKKAYTTLISVSSIGLVISAALYLDSAEHYFCATPTNILIRSGYLNASRLLTWRAS
jgi:hypothetical protein